MKLKYCKKIFIFIIIVLVLVGIYIIYFKDNSKQETTNSLNKEQKISRNISIGITDFDTLNPILTKNLEIQHITKLVYESLIYITPDFNTKPCIAEECSKINNKTYLVTLNPNKKWQNGEKITIEDIEFTINKIKTEDSIYRENVKIIEKIQKSDENTLKIILTEGVDFFEYYLSFPILEESTYNSEIPMGSGEFKIEKNQENEIIIKKDELNLTIKQYKTTTELYNAFTRGKVDLIITGNTNYEKDIGNIGFEETKIIGREFYYISAETITDKKTRKTIESAINKEKINYDLYNQKYHIAMSPLDYGSYLNQENTQGNWATENIKQSLKLAYSKEQELLAQKIKQELSQQNIKITLLPYKNQKADLILNVETTPLKPLLHQYFQNQEQANQIKKLYNIENKTKLKEAYGQILQNYYEEQPFIILYFSTYLVLHSDKLKGNFNGHWFNMFYNVESWYKEE